MKVMNRLATLPYVLTIFICVVLILPFGVYNIFTVYNSHSKMISAMEKDFNAYLKWVLVKDRSFMAEFFTYRLNEVHRTINKKLQSNLDVAQNVVETLYGDLPESKAVSLISKSSFSLPVYIITKEKKLVTGSKDLLQSHIDFLTANAELDTTSGSVTYLTLENNLKHTSFIIGTLIDKTEIKSMYRRDILTFFRHRENSGIFNFILEPNGHYMYNESRLFPGRRIAEKSEQDKAELLTQKFLQSTDKNNEEVVHYTWEIPGMVSQPPQMKLAFCRYETDLGWVIGTAIDSRKFEEYYIENQNHLRDKLHRDIRNLMVPFSLLFIAMLITGHLVAKKSLRGFAVFKNFFLKARKANEMIQYDSLSFEEFKDLAVVVNKMVEDRKRQRNIILAYTKKLRFSNKKLRNMANKDGLTGVANRRFFNEAMKKSWLNELRFKKPMTLGMIDIDFFKQYNDIYGHQMGDNSLIRVARCIKDTLKRPYDLVARYGGEEFIVLFPNTDSSGGMEIASKLQQEITGMKIIHEGSLVSPILTCSIGLATLVPTNKTTAKDLIEMADIALYNAKMLGRNRIVVHTSDMAMPGTA